VVHQQGCVYLHRWASRWASHCMHAGAMTCWGRVVVQPWNCLQLPQRHVFYLQAAAQATCACGAPFTAAAGGSHVQQTGVLLQQHLRSTRPRLSSSIRGFAASARQAGTAQKTAQAATKPAAASGSFSRWWKAFQQVPTVPRFLGLAGVSGRNELHAFLTAFRLKT
jgi:hypothetical protein